MRLSGLFSKMILAKSITPEEYGIITLMILSLPLLFQFLTNLFFHDLLSHSNKGSKYFGFSFLYGALASLLIFLILFVFHEDFFNFLNVPASGGEYLLLAFFITFLPSTFLINITGLLRGYKKYSLVNFLSISPSVLRLILLFIGIYVFSISGFNQIILLFAIPNLIITSLIFVKERKRLINRIRNINIPSKDMLFFGISIFVVSACIPLTQTMAKVVISHNLGVEMQGYFDVSLSILTIMAFSFGAMQFLSIPEATSNKSKEDILSKKGGLGDIARGLFAFLIYCFIVLYFYSVDLVTILFSHEYMKGAEYIYILAIGNIFIYIQQFLALLNISMGNNWREYKNIVPVTVILLISFPFITHIMITYFGFIAAYSSITLFFIVYTLATIYFSKDRSPLHIIFLKLDRLMAASCITFILIYHFRPSFIIGVMVSGTIYMSLVFLMGYLHKSLISDALISEKGIIRKIIGKILND